MSDESFSGPSEAEKYWWRRVGLIALVLISLLAGRLMPEWATGLLTAFLFFTTVALAGAAMGVEWAEKRRESE